MLNILSIVVLLNPKVQANELSRITLDDASSLGRTISTDPTVKHSAVRAENKGTQALVGSATVVTQAASSPVSIKRSEVRSSYLATYNNLALLN